MRLTNLNIFRHNLKVNLCLLFFIAIGVQLHAATITSTATGNWSDGSTWAGGVAPSSTDNVIIATSNVVTINGTYTCANLTIGSNASSPTAKITSAGNSLTITGLLTINSGNFGGTYTLDAGPGTININNTISWASTSGTNIIQTSSTGTVNITPAITISKTSQNIRSTVSGGTIVFLSDFTDQQNKLSTVAGSNIYFGGSYIVNTTAATLNSTSSAYFTGTGKTLVSTTDITFGHVYISTSASVTASGAGIITVAGNFELGSASTYTQNNDLYVKLNWTNNGGTLVGNSNHVYLTASSGTQRSINGTSSTAFPNLHIGKVGGTWAVKYLMSTNNSCSSLTLESNSGNTGFLKHSGTASLAVSGNVTIKQLTVDKVNSWFINAGSGTVGGNLIFSGTSNTVARIAQVVVTTGSFALTGTTTFMTNTASATEVISVTTGSLTFSSSLSMPQGSGTLKVSSSGTINFNGAAPSFSLNATVAGGTNATFTNSTTCTLNFANGFTNANAALTIKKGSFSIFTASSTVTPTAAITFGNITINSGATLTLAGDITLANDWLNNGGTFTPSTYTVTFTPVANGTQTITKTGGETFYSLTASLATGTLQLNSDVTITNTLNMSGHTFNLNGKTLTVGSGANATLTIAGVTTTTGFAYGGTFRRYWASGTTITATGSPYNGLFPIGILGDYRPVKLASTVAPTGGGYISVNITDAITVTDVTYTDNQGASVSRISDQIASVSNAGITGGTYNIDVTYNGFSNPGSAAYADYRLLTYTSSVLGSAGSNLTPVGNSLLNPVVRRTGLTIANVSNDFVCGSINSTNTPLQRVYYSRTTAPSPTNLDWNGATTWSNTGSSGTACSCTPDAAGFVVISNGTTVHVNVASTADKIEVQTGGKLDGTANLTTTNYISTAGTGYIAPTAGAWSIGSNLILNGTGASTAGATITTTGKVNLGTGTSLTMSATLSIASSLTVNSTLALGTSAMTLSGTGAEISGTGSITGSSTITISTDKTIPIGTNLTINPVFAISNNRTVTNQGTVTFNGNVTGSNANAGILNDVNGVINANAAFLSTGSLDASASPNTVNYGSSGAQSIKRSVPSYYNLTCSNSGTKTIANNLTIDNALTLEGTVVLDESTYILSGAGDLIMTSGSPELKIQRSSNTVSPELTGSFTLTAGTVTINQTANTNSVQEADYYNLKLTGAASYDLADVDLISKNFTVSGSSIWKNTSNNDLTVVDSILYSSSASSTLTGDVTVAAFKLTGGTIVDGGNTLTITKDWTNSGGTLTATGITKFTGSTAQNISGSTSTSFNDLTIANSNGVTLNVATTVKGLLKLTAGLVNSSSSNLLTLASTATTTIGSATSYVSGPMAYAMANNGSSTLIFPIGKDGAWRPAIVTPTHNTVTSYTYTGEVINSSARALNLAIPESITHVSGVRYWDISRSSGSTDLVSANVELYYSNTNGADDLVSNYTNLKVAKASTGAVAWTDLGGTASANSTGTIIATGITSFSRFSLANGAAGTNTLPVELLSFTAEPNGSSVELKWSTASEKNNDYFTIERTKDGYEYKELARVQGAGNSTSVLKYGAFDDEPYTGASYYRLKQTDFDGKTTYSKLQKVNFNETTEESSQLVLYPNPNEGEVINLDFTTMEDQQIIIEMHDLSGKNVYTLSLMVDKGPNKHTIYMANKLTSGTYIITTTTSDGKRLHSTKFTVE
jgi:hypothetical protein